MAVTQSQLTAEIQIVREETVLGANTKDRIAGILDDINSLIEINTVSYTPQTLNSSQQLQVLNNIGAASNIFNSNVNGSPTYNGNVLAFLSDTTGNVTSSLINGNIKINGTETNVYTLPSSLPASIIAQDTNNRFVTSSQISSWNIASTDAHVHPNKALLDTYTQTDANIASAISLMHNPVTIGSSNGLLLSGQQLSLLLANSSNSGALSNTDWNTFNNKVDKISNEAIGGNKIFNGITTINNNLTVNGNIYQTGSIYETHAQQVYTTNDLIILRDGALSGMTSFEYTGFISKLYDGVHDGQLVFDNTGTARVGDIGSLQPLATREEVPINQGFAYWNDANSKFQTKLLTTNDVSEGNNLYFTNTRSIEAPLSGYTEVNGTISSSDSVLSAIEKLGYNMHVPVTLGIANGLLLSEQQLSLELSSSGSTGALSNTDWNTFNSKQNSLISSVDIYIDGNRTDSYTANGTIAYPYKTISAAVSAITNASTLHIANGTYTESTGITFPNYPIVIYGNSSTINFNGGVAIITPYYTSHDLNSIGNITFITTGGRSLIKGGSISGNIQVVGLVNLESVSLSNGTITVTSTGILKIGLSAISSLISGSGIIEIDTVDITASSSSSLINVSAPGVLKLQNSTIINNGSGGAVIISNASVNSVINNIINTAGGIPVAVGTSPTIYSKNNITGGVNTGTGYIAANSDYIGQANMELGSDATGDIYYRNSNGILTNLAIGTSSQVLIGGTTPSYSSSLAGLTSVSATTLNGTIGIFSSSLTSPSFIVPNGTSSQFLKANGSIDSTTYVSTSGFYLNPTWLTGVPYSILTGTIPTWNQNTTGTASNITAYPLNQNVSSSSSPSFTGLTVPSIVGGNGVTSALNLIGTSGNGTLTSPAINFNVGNNGATNAVTVLNNGNVGYGVALPSAVLNIKAGTATAGTSPLKFINGINLIIPEPGAMEYDGTNLYFTPSTVRNTVVLNSMLNTYNVTVQIPLSPGSYYTSSTAHAAIPTIIQKIGLEITYEISAGIWVIEQYIGADLTNWGNLSYWTQIITGSSIYAESLLAYGVQWDDSIATSSCTRIGNLSLHAQLPIHNRIAAHITDANGAIVGKLNSTWNNFPLDGSVGDVMVKIPAHYEKCTDNGTVHTIMISDYPLLNYQYIPDQWISAFEASIQWSTGKLRSVINTTTDYRGGTNTSSYDGTDMSLLGMPVTNLSRTSFRTAARLLGSKYNEYTYQAHLTLTHLFYIEFADRNSQLPVNNTLTSAGYRQGGLGNGVTNLDYTHWANFNSINPFIPCGYTNLIGNGTGEIPYTMPFEYDSNGASNYLGVYNPSTSYVVGNYVSSGSTLYNCISGTTGNAVTNTTYWAVINRTITYANRYRGIELPFGHIWKWVDGVNMQVLSDVNGGTSTFYATNDPNLFSDSDYTGYESRGLLPRSGGYVKTILGRANGDILPATVGGGTTTYFCDYYYENHSSSFLAGLLLGGNAYHGADAGLVSAASNYSPSNAASTIGSRLCLIN